MKLETLDKALKIKKDIDGIVRVLQDHDDHKRIGVNSPNVHDHCFSARFQDDLADYLRKKKNNISKS